MVESPMISMTPNPAAFDEAAETYDERFSDTKLGSLLRRRVWSLMEPFFPPGCTVLELNCGTGIDALWLHRRGLRVTATDGSSKMLGVAQRRFLAELATVESFELDVTHLPEPNQRFDRVFSNFAGINVVEHWPDFFRRLHDWVNDGGIVVLMLMGKYCPWDLLWHGLHGRFRKAIRRFHQPAPGRIGSFLIPVWYPTVGKLRLASKGLFDIIEVRSVNLFLPTCEQIHLVERWPGFFRWIERIECATDRWFGGWGDHFLISFRKI